MTSLMSFLKGKDASPKAKREKEMERHQALGVSFHKEGQIVQTGSFFVFLKRKGCRRWQTSLSSER